MDSSAYLTKHGWLGTGHSLDPKGHGITKPLHLSGKFDLHGLGKRKHDAHADQWWARMFDSTLKELRLGEQEPRAHPEALVKVSGERDCDGLSQPFGGASALYGRFVKGGSLAGTIESQAEKQLQTDSSIDKINDGVEDREIKAVRRDKVEKKHVKKKSKSSESECSKEEKEDRRLRRMDGREIVESDRNRRGLKKGALGSEKERLKVSTRLTGNSPINSFEKPPRKIRHKRSKRERIVHR
jgi:nucleolar protein TMA23